MKLVTVAEMVAIEREADAKGHSYAQMMQLAGENLAKAVDETYSGFQTDGVLGIVGKGNNGGDTLVALLELFHRGWRATAYLATVRQWDEPLVDSFRRAGGVVLSAEDDADLSSLRKAIHSHAVLLDGLFGTGLKLPLYGPLGAVLAVVRAELEETDDPPMVVAVDCPSGMDCDTGETAPETIPADLTVTMGAPKTGLFAFPAHDYIGELQVVEIGLPPGLAAWQRINRVIVDDDLIDGLLPDRPLNAHKGTFGTAMVVAGSRNYTGAALLAGRAAYRVGAGLVTLGIPASLHTALAGHLPEATWLPLAERDGALDAPGALAVRDNLSKTTALLVGPGFGTAPGTAAFLEELFPGDQWIDILPTVVMDADGLKLLARMPGWPKRIPAPAVLTPHPGEMAILTSLPVGEIQRNRVAAAERFAKEWGHVVVLKGAFTVIAAPDGRTGVIPVASPALARAGTGDVLAGMVVGLVAQGLPPFEAALAGAWLHAQAGLTAAEKLGSSTAVMAGDLLDGLVAVLSQ